MKSRQHVADRCATFGHDFDENFHRSSTNRANIRLQDNDIVTLDRTVEVDSVVGSRNNRPAAMAPGGDRRCFINVFHQQPAKHRIVSVGITRQHDIFLDGQRFMHGDRFSFVHGFAF